MYSSREKIYYSRTHIHPLLLVPATQNLQLHENAGALLSGLLRVERPHLGVLVHVSISQNGSILTEIFTPSSWYLH